VKSRAKHKILAKNPFPKGDSGSKVGIVVANVLTTEPHWNIFLEMGTISKGLD